PCAARRVYVAWNRTIERRGPTWFARTVDGGVSWEAAREIYDPGTDSIAANNTLVVLPNGTLVIFFTEFANVDPEIARQRIIRSTDKGATWSAPITIADLQTVGTVDPETGVTIRDRCCCGIVVGVK